MIENDPIYKGMRVDTMLATRVFLINLERDRKAQSPERPFLEYAFEVIDADIDKNGGTESLKEVLRQIKKQS